MAKVKMDELKTAYQELIVKLGLQDEKTGEDIVIPAKITEKELTKALSEAITLIDPKVDKFTKETTATIKAFKESTAQAAVAEKIHQQNIGAKSPVVVEAEPEPEPEPVAEAKPKKVKEPKEPKPKKVQKEKGEEGYSRVNAIVEFLIKNPELKQKDLVSAADKLYVVKTGRTSNIKQTNRRYLTVRKVYDLLKAAL